MTKKTYKVPTLRIIDIKASEILAGSTPIGEIGGNGAGGNNNYDVIPGYNQGGWGIGSPD